jgi:acyl phosphate:glycerol-3-phosphate acyltransferase
MHPDNNVIVPWVVAIVIIAYLIGSFPSAYVIGRLWTKVDLRREGDGHISATAVYRYGGWPPFIVAGVLDAMKGILAVSIAYLISGSLIMLVAAAYAAAIGHSWSVFLKFMGGLGGVIVFIVMASVAPREAFIGVAGAGIFFIFIRKSSWATYLIQIIASIALFVEDANLLLCLFPLGLALLHYLKRYQARKASPDTAYKHELLADLKRLK